MTDEQKLKLVLEFLSEQGGEGIAQLYRKTFNLDDSTAFTQLWDSKWTLQTALTAIETARDSL